MSESEPLMSQLLIDSLRQQLAEARRQRDELDRHRWNQKRRADRCEASAARWAGLAKLAEQRLAEVRQERDMLRPADITADECSLGVLAVRMIRSGHSYDAEAGIWWNATDKPGVLQAAEQQVARLTKALEKLGTDLRDWRSGGLGGQTAHMLDTWSAYALEAVRGKA